MIILGVDYHPSVQQVAFLDTETDWRKLRLLPEGRVNRKLSHSAKSVKLKLQKTPFLGKFRAQAQLRSR
jgi:hypothetical protein